MNTTDKIKLKNIFNRCISLFISTVMSFAFLMADGCNNAKIIEDYPEADTTPVVVSKDADIPADDEETTQKPADDIDREYDSIWDTGTFVYNPEAIAWNYREEMKNKEASYKAAKKILKAVYDRETEFELSADDGFDEMDFNRGIKLARMSSPLVSCVDITMTDINKYEIRYFPELSDDYTELIYVDTDMADVERKYTAFEEYVTETINNNITADDDYMERAEKIYRFLMDDIELENDKVLLEQAAYMNPFVLTLEFYDTNIIDVPETKKLNHWQFILLYDFFLTQLNVKHYVILGGGTLTDTSVESIREAFEITDEEWGWIMITDENDNSYQCDILMDKLVLDEQRKSQKDYESDMLYFGMSDKKRNESLDLSYKIYGMTMDPNRNNTGAQFPECNKDY